MALGCVGLGASTRLDFALRVSFYLGSKTPSIGRASQRPRLLGRGRFTLTELQMLLGGERHLPQKIGLRILRVERHETYKNKQYY